MVATHLIETSKFAILASDAQIERTMKALETNNIHVIIAENGAAAETWSLKKLLNPSCDPARTAQTLNISATDFTNWHRFFDKFV